MVSAVQEGLGRPGRAEGPGRSDPAGSPRLVFLHDFPESQAALARVRRPTRRPADESPEDEPAVAERFELFADGLELANGFHELTDPAEQRRRFERDLALRRERGLPEVPVDERFLAALEAGMPEGAGVALGFDRLVMVALGAEDVAEVMAFPIERA
jgi:lysyl-tRNA synthetase class 2